MADMPKIFADCGDDDSCFSVINNIEEARDLQDNGELLVPSVTTSINSTTDHESTDSPTDSQSEPRTVMGPLFHIPVYHWLVDQWRRIYIWFLGVPVPLSAENLGLSLVQAMDSPSDPQYPPDGCYVTGSKTSYRDRPSYLAEVVAECKISIEGITKETAANALVGRRWLSKKMQGDGLRPTHIARILPTAVEMLFVPDKYELEAEQFRLSKAVLNRLDEYQTGYTARHPFSLWNWLGSKRSRPRPVG